MPPPSHSPEDDADLSDEHELTDDRLRRLAPTLNNDQTKFATLRALRDLQKEHDDIFANYIREKQELEHRYETQFTPLFTRRKQQLDREPIENFWLRAFEHCEVLRENITEKDALVLKSLTDVSCQTVTSMEPPPDGALQGLPMGSFVLTFRFADNDFFENDVLTKVYIMQEDDFEELDEAKGSKVLWKPGKDITMRTMKKKTKNGRVLIRKQPADSFFNFFSPPQGMMDVEGEVDPSLIEELEDVMDADFELGDRIRTEVIPRALLYYLDVAENDEDESESEESSNDGSNAEDTEEKREHAANGTDDLPGSGGEDGDDENDEDDEDDEDEDEDEAGRGGRGKTGPKLPPAAQSAEDCKQQ